MRNRALYLAAALCLTAACSASRAPAVGGGSGGESTAVAGRLAVAGQPAGGAAGGAGCDACTRTQVGEDRCPEKHPALWVCSARVPATFTRACTDLLTSDARYCCPAALTSCP